MIDTTLPDLNVELLFDLIKWAERDKRYLDKFLNWGSWDQGVWGTAIVPEDLVAEDDEDELAIKDMEELKREILNGACGTSFCMAGQAVIQSGYRMQFNNYLDDEKTVGADYCIKIEDTGQKDEKGRKIFKDVGEAKSIAYAAQDVLGLDDNEADNLFSGGNTLDNLCEYANAFCNQRGLPLLFPEHGLAY